MKNSKDFLEGFDKFRMQMSIIRGKLGRARVLRPTIKLPDAWPKISEIPDGFIRQ